MKQVLVSTMLLTMLQFQGKQPPTLQGRAPVSGGNLVIITTDGFRWQELFTGADSALLMNEEAVRDAEMFQLLYGGSTAEERRMKLMPFFWSVIARKGQVYGNRLFDNRVNTANAYSISYPGYNEIFTGTTDAGIASNQKINNPNLNVLEYLDQQPAFTGKVAAFSSWDVFPYILNEKRNKLPVYSGYENNEAYSRTAMLVNEVQGQVADKKATRYDALTFLSAKEYLHEHRPKVLFLGLGETDEFAHEGRYDLYLQQANAVDKMIAELWHWVQTTPGYKDNTTFIITTDHGRGRKRSKWTSHGAFIGGSSETWLAVIGPNIAPLGELKDRQQLYQQQLAQTIANLLGRQFEAGQPVAAAIPFPAVTGRVLRENPETQAVQLR